MHPEEHATELEIQRLLVEFFGALDSGNYPRLTDLMAPDGIWCRQGKQLRGRNEILEALQQRDPNRLTVHTICNLLIQSQASDEVVARFAMVVFSRQYPDNSNRDHVEPSTYVGRYCARLLRLEGRWRINELDGKNAFDRKA